MGIINFFRSFDYFGGSFQLNMKGSETTQTLLGFFFSLSFIILLGLTTFWYTSEFLDTSSPEIQTKDYTNSEYSSFVLNRDKIYTYMFLTDGEHFITRAEVSKYIRLSARLEKSYLDENSQSTKHKSEFKELGVVPCTQTQWYKEKREELFREQDRGMIDSFGLCVDDSAQSLDIFGGIESDTYQFLSIIGKICNLATGCKTATEMKNAKVVLGFLEGTFASENKKTPFQTFKNEQWRFKLRGGTRKQFVTEIDKVKAFTDTGYFFDLIREDHGFSLGNSNLDSRVFYTGDDELLVADIYSSNRHLEFTRGYTKALDLFSNIGGVVEIIFFVVGILYTSYNTFIMTKNMVRFGIMKKGQEDDAEENPKDAKTGPVKKKDNYILDDHEYESVLKYKLINWGVYKTNNEIEKKRAKYYKDCEALLSHRMNIYNLIANLNELIIFKDIFFEDYHKKLAPYVAITQNVQKAEEAKHQENDSFVFGNKTKKMSIYEAIHNLKNNEPSNSIEKALNEYVLKGVENYRNKDVRLGMVLDAFKGSTNKSEKSGIVKNKLKDKVDVKRVIESNKKGLFNNFRTEKQSVGISGRKIGNNKNSVGVEEGSIGNDFDTIKNSIALSKEKDSDSFEIEDNHTNQMVGFDRKMSVRSEIVGDKTKKYSSVKKNPQASKSRFNQIGDENKELAEPKFKTGKFFVTLEKNEVKPKEDIEDALSKVLDSAQDEEEN